MRKTLSKTLRFEVFKRDKFTCQYCGDKAPDVILHVDHIEPVSKGGKDTLINLITSCIDCNSGKSDKKLSDDSAVKKQHKQLELVQERREQIELMFKWKKSLERLGSTTKRKIRNYINKKITPFTISDQGFSKIEVLIRKYDVNTILNAIDISIEKYLKYSFDGELLQDSVNDSINKIGGILFNKSLSPVDQKLARIKSVAKSSFNYFDIRSASIILDKYVKALRNNWDFDDETIILDLENEVLPMTQKSKNWSEWKSGLEMWIKQIEEYEEDVNLEEG